MGSDRKRNEKGKKLLAQLLEEEKAALSAVEAEDFAELKKDLSDPAVLIPLRQKVEHLEFIDKSIPFLASIEAIQKHGPYKDLEEKWQRLQKDIAFFMTMQKTFDADTAREVEKRVDAAGLDTVADDCLQRLGEAEQTLRRGGWEFNRKTGKVKRRSRGKKEGRPTDALARVIRFLYRRNKPVWNLSHPKESSQKNPRGFRIELARHLAPYIDKKYLNVEKSGYISRCIEDLTRPKRRTHS